MFLKNMNSYYFCLIIVFSCHFKILHCKSPNFVVILTDDQDITLGGMFPMKQTKYLIADHGVEFKNMFVTTPLCCPSRSSILTGRYAHNHGVRNNSLSGNCNSRTWQNTQEKATFITKFKDSGYSTFYAGKYLNQYGSKPSGGVKHIPPGWDHWIALVGNSRYYNYSLSRNGKREDHGSDPKKDYLTDIVFTEAIEFLRKHNQTKPFFMFLSPPAPHAPFTPFPTYVSNFSSFQAPRTPNFAKPAGKNKHWLLQQPPIPLPATVIDKIDDVFRNRWRTLLSVDEYIHKIFQMLTKLNLLENTYVFFSSDNGFHLGQFSLPWDKRQPYEFDIRVPLLVRGPGIEHGTSIIHPVLNIDLAPTFLELADLPALKEIDGESFTPLLKKKSSNFSHRTLFLIEHQGEYSEKSISGCPQYQPKEVNNCEIDCICEDAWNNTYNCLRELSKMENAIVCLFEDNQNFVEAYNISEDPYQMRNLYYSSNRDRILSKLKQFNIKLKT